MSLPSSPRAWGPRLRGSHLPRRGELNKKVEDGHKDLTARIDGLNDKLHSWTIRALLLYFAFTLASDLLKVICAYLQPK